MYRLGPRTIHTQTHKPLPFLPHSTTSHSASLLWPSPNHSFSRNKLTPSDLIVLVITELGYLPPSSVPVVIREYRKEVTL